MIPTRPPEAAEAAVLVVGAGPVGLTLASELLRFGVPCRVVDMNEGPSLWSKAAVVHARTLEAFAAMGIADQAVALGRRLHGLGFFSGEKRIGHVSVDSLDSPYPFLLGLSQRETEQLLERHLIALGGRVERQVELATFARVEGGVTATLVHAGRPGDEAGDRREVVTTPWLVGCDGAHSMVRKTLDVPFEGSTYEETILQADVRIRWPFAVPEDEGLFFVSPHGVLGALPLLGDGRYRLLALLAADEQHDPTLDSFQTLMDERGPAGTVVADPAWMVAFRFHHRKAATTRVGRVFLAGDAAHVHSPVGGQGMNIGIQDAFNLAWKLALVIRGEGHASLLDSYHAERSPIAAATLGLTAAATRFGARALGLRSPVAQRVRDQLFSLAGRLPLVEERAAALLGGLALDYRASPIVSQDVVPIWPVTAGLGLQDRVSFEHGPGPGHRVGDVEMEGGGEAPPRLFELLHARTTGGPAHTLLLFDARTETPDGYRALGHLARAVRASYGDRIRVFVVTPHAEAPSPLDWDGAVVPDPAGALHRRFGARAECLYLVRPDGYVAYRSQPADEEKLLAYLATVLVG